MKRRYFAVGFVLILLCCIVGLYFGLTNVRLVSKKTYQVEADGKKYEQTVHTYSNNTAVAGMSAIGDAESE